MSSNISSKDTANLAGHLSSLARDVVYTPVDKLAQLIEGQSLSIQEAIRSIFDVKELNIELVTEATKTRLLDALDTTAHKLLPINVDDDTTIRLADNGLIQLDALTPMFEGALFSIIPRTMEMDKNIARETVKNADADQTIETTINQFAHMRLFGKRFGGKTSKDQFVLIVVCQRLGLKLFIRQYWRMYVADIVLKDAASLNDLYISFVEKFGIVLDNTESNKTLAAVHSGTYVSEAYFRLKGVRARAMFAFSVFRQRMYLSSGIVEKEALSCGVDLEIYLDRLVEKGAIRQSFKNDLIIYARGQDSI